MSMLYIVRAVMMFGVLLLQVEGGRIEIGQTVEGDLRPGEEIVYHYEGAAGEGVTVTLDAAGSDWDPVLEIYDPDGGFLAFGDDDGGTRSAAIRDLALPVSGDYTILVRSYGNRSGGAYTLTLARGAPPPTPAVGGGVMIVGETVTAEIVQPGQQDAWTFAGQAGDVVSVLMQSGQIDAVLALYGPGGDELAHDDDSGGNSNALIYGYTLPEDGAYTIAARAFHESQTGPYRLALLAGAHIPEAPTTTPTPAPVTMGALTPGETVQADLNFAPSHAWTFDGEAGEVVSLVMHTVAFDAYLIVYGPAGALLAFNDDSGPGASAAVYQLYLPSDGAYTVIAQAASGLTGGQYALTMRKVALAAAADALATGPARAGDLAPGEVDVWAFTIAEARTATVSVPARGELASTGVEIFSIETGSILAGIDFVSAPLVAPGDYFVWVYALDGQSAGRYDITLTLGEPPVVGGGEIMVGQRIAAFMPDGGAADLWTLKGPVSERPLAISMAATGAKPIDPYLEVFGPGGYFITSDDDGGGGLNALVRGLVLAERGDYTIFARDYQYGQGGSYTLEVLEIPPVELGQVVTGMLANEADFDVWALPIEEPAALEVLVESETGLSAELTGPGSQAQLIDSTIAYPLRTPGVYTIVVTGLGGDYTMTLNRGEMPQDRHAAISYDTRAAGVLAPGQRDTWTFTARAGEVVSIRVESPAFDIYMELLDADETVIAWDDDNGGYTDALLTAYTLPADGEYHIMVRGFDVAGAGPYLLSVFQGAAVPGMPGASGGRIEPGQTVRGELAEVGARDSWSLIVPRAGNYALETGGSAGALYLTVYDPGGAPFYRGAVTDPLFSAIYLDGVEGYRVEVSLFAAEDTRAPYTLRFEPAGAGE
ncbi:MAG: PPC domain-containing protein [Anaerolineae bacterium]|nr:PPC domain-containing protein [Anaerolineae bacterium]